jgi:curved DNA-binding protein CbpA
MRGELCGVKMDAFALLDLPRRASLSGEEVRAAFQRKGAALHPDGAGEEERARRTAEFAALNEAHAILSSQPRRLRHLLELGYPGAAAAKTGAVMDGEMMTLFSSVGGAVQEAAAVQSRKQKASSALARAMLAGEEMKAQEALETATQGVEAAREKLDAELAEWDTGDAGDGGAAKLQSCAARAGFLEKWQAQLRGAFAGFFGG